MVGPKNRNLALEAGVCQWTDKKCTPAILGINGEKTSKILSAIIDINRSKKVKIAPKVVRNNIGAWKSPDKIEFFVDFETCNGVVSSIKRLPEAKTDTIVFMIGVGYIDPDTNKWISKDFTVDRLTFEEEARICREFSDFIREKAKQYGVKKPRCIHWARAEDIMWTDAVERHDPISDEWKSWVWDWLDLLVVFKEEPIVINGCMSFGLKDVAAAMKKHGFIKTAWNKKSACVDGQSAMVAARKAHNTASSSGISMKQVPIMKQIREYNKVDVRVLYEIITYLRSHHIKSSNDSEPESTQSDTSSFEQSDIEEDEEENKSNKKKRSRKHSDQDDSESYEAPSRKRVCNNLRSSPNNKQPTEKSDKSNKSNKRSLQQLEDSSNKSNKLRKRSREQLEQSDDSSNNNNKKLKKNTREQEDDSNKSRKLRKRSREQLDESSDQNHKSKKRAREENNAEQPKTGNKKTRSKRRKIEEEEELSMLTEMTDGKHSVNPVD